MASLKDLRNRIASVKATQKITKAMQMVAAAKLRRAQERAEAARPYAESMGAVLGNLARTFEGRPDAPQLMVGNGRDNVHLLVVCTAERGLCGGFNSSIARLTRVHASKLITQGKDVKILCVGRKGYDALKRDYGSYILDDNFEFRAIKAIGYEHANQVATRLISLFEAGEFDVCTLFYSRFKSVMTQIPTAHGLIPAEIGADQGGDMAGAMYECEPDENDVLNDLLPRNLSVQVFRALLENGASEQGARMSAMDSATRNAGDMIDKLTLSYNRQRQAQITKELIEIISGAEAL